MNSLTAVDIRAHFTLKRIPSFKPGQRRYTSLSSRAPVALYRGWALCDRSRNIRESPCRFGEVVALRAMIPTRRRSSLRSIAGVTGNKRASFSTAPYHQSPDIDDVDLNGNGVGNGNGDSHDARQLVFSRVSNLIEGDDGVVGTSSIWYVVATAALLGLNRQSMLNQLWKYISDQCGRDEARMLAIARRVREACLKSSVLVGFPHGINGLLSLQSSVEQHSPSIASTLASDTSLRASVTPAEKYTRGKEFFSAIYAKHTDRVLASMGRSSGRDLDYYAVASVYGELMSETSILGAAETGILEFVCCLVCDVAPQAKGHFYGCKNLGTTGVQMRGTLSLVRELATQLDLSPDRIPGQGKRYAFLEKAKEW